VEDVIDASEDDSGFPLTPPGHDRPSAAASSTPGPDKAQRSPGLALVVNGVHRGAPVTFDHNVAWLAHRPACFVSATSALQNFPGAPYREQGETSPVAALANPFDWFDEEEDDPEYQPSDHDDEEDDGASEATGPLSGGALGHSDEYGMFPGSVGIEWTRR